MQSIWKIEFPEDEMCEFPNAAAMKHYDHIKDAVRNSGAAITKDILENGMRKIGVLMPDNEVETFFRLIYGDINVRIIGR